MNHISKTHQSFSERLNEPRVLTNPEELLGENYEAVLNFWMILDELSEEQFEVVNKREEDFFNENRSEWDKAKDLAWEAAKEVVGSDYTYYAGLAVYDIRYSFAACWTTRELIGMHKILEDRQQPLTFFPMFLDLLS